MGLGCAVRVAELRPRDVASVAGRSPVPSRSVALYPKSSSLHTFGFARPSRSGVFVAFFPVYSSFEMPYGPMRTSVRRFWHTVQCNKHTVSNYESDVCSERFIGSLLHTRPNNFSSLADSRAKPCLASDG